MKNNDETFNPSDDDIVKMLNRFSKGEATPLDILYLANFIGLEGLGIENYAVKGSEEYCDMHNHSTHSDGLLTPIEILYISKLLGLNRVVIADHDCVDAYLDPEVKQVAEELGIELMPSCEFVAAFEDVGIEILGYGIDPVKAKEYLDKNGITQNTLERYRSDMIPKVFANLGIKLDYDPSKIDFSLKDPRVLHTIYPIILKNPEAVKLMEEENPELLKGTSQFLRAGLNNPNSKFFIEPNSFYPQYNKIVKVIHDLGGVAILAHPYQYKAEMHRVLEGVKDSVDGIECIHPSSREPEKTQTLLDFCEKNNLLVTGGSDSHNLDPNSDKGMFNGLRVPAKYYDLIKDAIKARQNINQPM